MGLRKQRAEAAEHRDRLAGDVDCLWRLAHGIATHEGPEQEAYLRAAKQGDSYFIDLGSDDWRVIEVNRNGWHHWPASPLPFWRSTSVRPLPVPVPGGNLAKLWDYVNIPPVLELVGSHGSAKSSTQAKLRQCVDPNAVDLRAAPKYQAPCDCILVAFWISANKGAVSG